MGSHNISPEKKSYLLRVITRNLKALQIKFWLKNVKWLKT
jgi:hypothetical protein